jgi:MerR family transcriptional regulator, heat shock protein HspR
VAIAAVPAVAGAAPGAGRSAVAPASSAAVYGISVAAELAGCGVQALRLYERRGLVEPDRTAGGTRRYSQDDLARVRRITTLLGAGLNLTGVGEVLALEAENAELRAENAQLKAHQQSTAPRTRRR